MTHKDPYITQKGSKRSQPQHRQHPARYVKPAPQTTTNREQYRTTAIYNSNPEIYTKNATPAAPASSATASAPTRRLFTFAAPVCSLAVPLAVVLAPAAPLGVLPTVGVAPPTMS